MLARAHDSSPSSRPVERAVRSAARGKRLVLAVSGGRDSMVMLHAAARVARSSVVVVATFDHGTGPVARRAAAHVAREAAALGFPVVLGRAARVAGSEAEWREMRLAFLEDVARKTGGAIATAHTRDDQVETVLMRVLRGSGARGLAGLYAAGDTVRPLLDTSREDVARFASATGVTWVEDPSNASDRHLRNRIRRDLLPALSRARPGFEEHVLSVARNAAGFRVLLDALVRRLVAVNVKRDGIAVPALALTSLAAGELALLWPAIAARAGARTDRRGTDRLVAFTREGRVGKRIQISGGWEVSRTRDAFELRRANTNAPETRALRDGAVFDAWTFSTPARDSRTPWTAVLPPEALTVRRWSAGDRMRAAAGDPPRLVKRFLSDAHVSGSLRARWPVVLSGDEIVWIPGIRRGATAAERPGRPGVPYRCELNDR